MTNLARFVNVLSGWNGGPGVNVMHFSQGSNPDLGAAGVQEAYDEIHAMYSANVQRWLPGITIAVDRAPSIIDEGTGDVINVINVGTPSTDLLTAAGGQNAARMTMFCVRYSTDLWIRGRRLQGRGFFGPVSQTEFGPDGNVNSAARAAWDDSFTAMTSGVGVRLAVYQRPSLANGGVGKYGDVVSADCLQKPGILRSRRD